MDEQSCRSQLIEWMKEIVPFNNLDVYVRQAEIEGINGFRFAFSTEWANYSISVHIREGVEPYLGCISSCRKSLAGEDWLRGSDLPDGKFNRQTWEAIKDAILRHELVKLVPVHVPVGIPVCAPPIGEVPVPAPAPTV